MDVDIQKIVSEEESGFQGISGLVKLRPSLLTEQWQPGGMLCTHDTMY